MTVTILPGDARDVLKTLPSDHFHCIVTSPPYFNLRSYLPEGHPDKPLEMGSEPTVSEYVAGMVELFRELRRVLRPDGVAWLNLGDSFSSSTKGSGGKKISSLLASGRGRTTAAGCARSIERQSGPVRRLDMGDLPEKNLIGIPWRVALALQDDGWWLRRDIIWSKPNCMPESCTDRCTTSHEYVFHLTRSAQYFYDAEAIKEETTGGAHSRGTGVNPRALKAGVKVKQNASFSAAVTQIVFSRNRRSVWTIATQPTSEAHFATMPAVLAERCILAGSSEHGCCAACGAPYERVIERGEADLDHQRACGGDHAGAYAGTSRKGHAAAGVQDASAVKARILAGLVQKRTVGWKPACACGASVAPCRVLDPFGGSGTTAIASDRLGRDCTLIELHPDYPAMAKRRLTADAGMFARVDVVQPATPPAEIAAE